MFLAMRQEAQPQPGMLQEVEAEAGKVGRKQARSPRSTMCQEAAPIHSSNSIYARHYNSSMFVEILMVTRKSLVFVL